MAAAIIALTLQVVISIILKMIDVMMKIVIFAHLAEGDQHHLVT